MNLPFNERRKDATGPPRLDFKAAPVHESQHKTKEADTPRRRAQDTPPGW